MKHSKRYLAVLLALMLLLTACGGQKTPADSPEVSPQIQTPEDSKPPQIPEVPQTSGKPGPSGILKDRQTTDASGALWQIPNRQVESGMMQRLLLVDHGLLLYGSDIGADGKPAFCLRLMSMDTGQTLHEISLSELEIPEVQQLDCGIAVTDWMDGKIILLDETLQIVKEYDANAESCGVFVDPSFTKAFVISKEEGIRITDMQTGETIVFLENATHLLAAGRCGSSVSVSYTDRNSQLSCHAVVDLAVGTVEAIPFEGSFTNVQRSGNTWLAGLFGEEKTCYLGRTGRPSAFTLEAQYATASLLPDPGRILIRAHSADGTSLGVYGFDGSFLSACSLPVGATLTGEPVWSERDGGYYFTVVDPTGKDLLLFWDLATPVAGKDLVITPAYTGQDSAGNVISAELYARAQALCDYGVIVKIAEQIPLVFREYSVQQELDEAHISNALGTVEAVLKAYPDGFFRQLPHGAVREIVLYLTGSIKKTTEDATNGFTTFVGFVESEGSVSRVVLDITQPGSVAQTLHHEIFHLIDNKLTFDAGIRADALYSEEGWNALNPDGFVYAESYHDLPMDFYQSGYEAWFAELYSRTYAREDRATIFEHAMVRADWIFSGSSERWAKLEYLCRIIRDCFDSAGWPEQTVWEQTLARTEG